MIKTIVLVLLLSTLTNIAQADIWFAPAVFYNTTDFKDANEEPEQKKSNAETQIDFRLGYLLPGGVYLGGIYGIANATGKDGDTSTSENATRIGASLGFTMSSFYLIGHYFLTAMRSTKSGETIKDYSSGSGLQTDLGWRFMIASTIGFGPQIVWRSLTYKKRVVNPAGTETTKSSTYAEIHPALAFFFSF